MQCTNVLGYCVLQEPPALYIIRLTEKKTLLVFWDFNICAIICKARYPIRELHDQFIKFYNKYCHIYVCEKSCHNIGAHKIWLEVSLNNLVKSFYFHIQD